jgi:hypothetical protein
VALLVKGLERLDRSGWQRVFRLVVDHITGNGSVTPDPTRRARHPTPTTSHVRALMDRQESSAVRPPGAETDRPRIRPSSSLGNAHGDDVDAEPGRAADDVRDGEGADRLKVKPERRNDME